MYQKIKAQPTVLTQYAQRLVREKLLSPGGLGRSQESIHCEAERRATTLAKKNAEAYELQEEALPPAQANDRPRPASATNSPRA